MLKFCRPSSKSKLRSNRNQDAATTAIVVSKSVDGFAGTTRRRIVKVNDGSSSTDESDVAVPSPVGFRELLTKPNLGQLMRQHSARFCRGRIAGKAGFAKASTRRDGNVNLLKRSISAGASKLSPVKGKFFYSSSIVRCMESNRATLSSLQDIAAIIAIRLQNISSSKIALAFSEITA
ncbi:uncharacterized protein LOC129751969 [Uranotaenia lowii]|uniref:uncharacterized protein LOC129751969 n=1 Tax=Uranotaenia lowii TaxID=190385 RepID=UPI002478D3E9|nr:uncharacterized protein LOC129751969 [Uranotaenia lowii]